MSLSTSTSSPLPTNSTFDEPELAMLAQLTRGNFSPPPLPLFSPVPVSVLNSFASNSALPLVNPEV
ncbi:MAG: hypothetical protein JKX92_00710 [Porticoccaceae bacterium]|nr:hypothetical protein [Porticoccaceae bacterium]